MFVNFDFDCWQHTLSMISLSQYQCFSYLFIVLVFVVGCILELTVNRTVNSN